VALLSSDLVCLYLEVNKILCNGVDWLHIDIIDRHFVHDIAFNPTIKSMRKHPSLKNVYIY